MAIEQCVGGSRCDQAMQLGCLRNRQLLYSGQLCGERFHTQGTAIAHRSHATPLGHTELSPSDLRANAQRQIAVLAFRFRRQQSVRVAATAGRQQRSANGGAQNREFGNRRRRRRRTNRWTPVFGYLPNVVWRRVDSRISIRREYHCVDPDGRQCDIAGRRYAEADPVQRD